MLKKVLFAAVGIVAILLVVISLQPDSYTVTRSDLVPGPPETSFALVNDFSKWNAWSPWAKLDPNMKQTLSANPAGRGATYYWNGNDDVGEGRMTITSSTPASAIDIDLEFLKPFASQSKTKFTFQPDGSDTKVTWSMTGQHNFISKAMCLVMDMDKMVGGDFEKGLNQMKSAAVTK